jgi:arylsulfatase A-like enzyme
LDRSVGRILALIKEMGLDENTIVIFSSDNGGAFGEVTEDFDFLPGRMAGTDYIFFESTGKFRAFKGSVHEGGIRVPFIARWPGRIAPAATSGHVGYFGDMMTTFAEIAGAKAPAALDSVSLVPTLTGRGAQARHDYLYWEFYESGFTQAVLLDGRWKGIRLKDPLSPIALYDQTADPAETKDVATAHPPLVERIAALMRTAHVDNEYWKWPR